MDIYCIQNINFNYLNLVIKYTKEIIKSKYFINNHNCFFFFISIIYLGEKLFLL